MGEMLVVTGLMVAAATVAGSIVFATIEAAALRFVTAKWAALIAGGVAAASGWGLVLGLARIISIPRSGEHKPTPRFWYPSAALCLVGALVAFVGWRMEVSRLAARAACQESIGKVERAPHYVIGCEFDGRPRVAEPHRRDANGTVWFAVREGYAGRLAMHSAGQVAEHYDWDLLSADEYRKWTQDDPFGEFLDFQPTP